MLVIFDTPLFIQSQTESMRKLMGAGRNRAFFVILMNCNYMGWKWARRVVPCLYLPSKMAPLILLILLDRI